MASDITLSNEPGHYDNSVQVKVTWPADARRAIVTRGSVPPVLTEVLAYDKGPIGPDGTANATTASVQRPFIAVTQDGKGNIVYDGGFPKYYNATKPRAAIVPLTGVFQFQGWCNPANNNGQWGSGNDAYYETFSNVAVTIAAGDTLQYGELLYGLTPQSGIDARIAGGPGNMRDYAITPGLNDTNGLSAHPGNDLSGWADGQWYYRTIPLDAFAGKVMDQWRVAFEGDNPGWYTSYFREVYVKDRNGNIKATLFANGNLTVPNVVGADNGNTGSYQNITKKVVNLSVFDQLPGSYKYLYNVMSFIANPLKVAAGNKKILVIGNVTGNNDYGVKNSVTNPALSTSAQQTGFKDSFDLVASVAGYTLAYYDTGDAGGQINLTAQALQAYAGVIFVSSYYANTPADRKVTDAFAQELSLYRSQGNGVFIVTDHSTLGYTSPADAAANSTGFLRDANILTQYSAAYFTNYVDRHPVSVATIRQELIDAGGDGTHPLLNNLNNGDAIYAGGSESLVIVDTFPNNQVSTATAATYTLSTPGDNWLNILVQRNDGTVFVKALKYVVTNPEAWRYLRVTGEQLAGVWRTQKLGWDITFETADGSMTTLIGSLFKNNVLQGYWQLNKNKLSTYYFAGAGKTFPIANGDSIRVRVEQPYVYNVKSAGVIDAGRNPLVDKLVTVGQTFGTLFGTEDYKDVASARQVLQLVTTYLNRFILDDDINPLTGFHYPTTIAWLKRAMPGPLGSCSLWVAPTAADWTANKPVGPTIGQAAIVAATNDVYYWDIVNTVWALHPQKANTLFGLNRKVRNTRDNKMWKIGSGTTVLI